MKVTVTKPPIDVSRARWTVEKTADGFATTSNSDGAVGHVVAPLDLFVVVDGDGAVLSGIVQSVTRHVSGDGIIVTVEVKKTA